ncbi:response regulator [Oscillatoria salina]|uniref:response regulator n=1 Tax=Oscillatoria salina TaxID=331517 RepID=UPI001CCB67C8|nr:response regulator [Oscillatoria salina]MBZ8179397.1 response regulator [Oscillatoria salina IIICB1]
MAHKILIVENNSDVRMRVIKMLPSGNYEILEAEDGEEALTKIRSQQPKFIFLNWKLPKINGWELYQKMQTDEQLQKTAVVMMCRRQEEIAAKIPQAFQYFEYIERPFNKKQLIEAIKSATKKAKQPRSQTPPPPPPPVSESEDDALKAGISSIEKSLPEDLPSENPDLNLNSVPIEPVEEVTVNPFAESEEETAESDFPSEVATVNPFASTTEELEENDVESEIATPDLLTASSVAFDEDEDESSEQEAEGENIIALGSISEQAEVESEASDETEFDFGETEAFLEENSPNQEFDFNNPQENDLTLGDISEVVENFEPTPTESTVASENPVSKPVGNFEESLDSSSSEEKILVLQEAAGDLEKATNVLLEGLNDSSQEVQIAAYKQLRDYNNRQTISLALVEFTPYLIFECIHTLDVHSSGGVTSLAISPDRQTLVSSSIQGNIQLWNLDSGELLGALNKSSHQVTSVAIALDGETLYTSSQESNLKIWNLYTGELLGPLNQSSAGVSAIAIALDGQRLYTGAYETNIKIWNLYTGELLGALNQNSSQVTSLAVSPDGLTLVSGSNNNNIQVWDVRTGELYYQLTGHSQPVNGVAVSPDGRIIISGSDDRTVKIWDLQTGELLRTIDAHPGGVKAVAVSPDGQFIVSGGNLDLKIWGVA